MNMNISMELKLDEVCYLCNNDPDITQYLEDDEKNSKGKCKRCNGKGTQLTEEGEKLLAFLERWTLTA